MTLKEYLGSHREQNQLTLVGPLFNNAKAFGDPVVFVDGGANNRRENEGFTVGDGDSSSHAMDEKLNPEKDFSDLGYILNEIVDRFEDLTLHGFLGGRKDHELINLAEIHSLLKKRTRPLRVKLDEELIAVSKGKWRFQIQGTFSVFLFEHAKLTLSGDCKYPVGKNNPLNALSSHGLSNEGSGEVELVCDGPVFVFMNSEYD